MPSLLVITPTRAVARWAARPIAIGQPGFTLTPIAVALPDLPRSVGDSQAHKLPELAVLIAIGHPEVETAIAAFAAIAGLPVEQNRLYSDIILSKLSAEHRQLVENQMEGYVYKSAYVIKHFIEPVERATKAGREAGLSEGHCAGLQDALRVLVRSKLKVVSRAHEAVIRALDNPRTLTRLIGALGQASDATRARKVMATALRKPRRAVARGRRPSS